LKKGQSTDSTPKIGNFEVNREHALIEKVSELVHFLIGILRTQKFKKFQNRVKAGIVIHDEAVHH
jgi:hypothetical protein